MGRDALAEMPREHLCAKTNAKERLSLAQRHADEIGLGLDEIVRIVGALWSAEDHRARMIRHGFGQRIAIARPADVEFVTALAQRVTDTTRGRLLLVQDEKNFFVHHMAARGTPRFNS